MVRLWNFLHEFPCSWGRGPCNLNGYYRSVPVGGKKLSKEGQKRATGAKSTDDLGKNHLMWGGISQSVDDWWVEAQFMRACLAENNLLEMTDGWVWCVNLLISHGISATLGYAKLFPFLVKIVGAQKLKYYNPFIAPPSYVLVHPKGFIILKGATDPVHTTWVSFKLIHQLSTPPTVSRS